MSVTIVTSGPAHEGTVGHMHAAGALLGVSSPPPRGRRSLNGHPEASSSRRYSDGRRRRCSALYRPDDAGPRADDNHLGPIELRWTLSFGGPSLFFSSLRPALAAGSGRISRGRLAFGRFSGHAPTRNAPRDAPASLRSTKRAAQRRPVPPIGEHPTFGRLFWRWAAPKRH